MPFKTSQEVFNENLQKSGEQAKRNAEKSSKIRELRQQLNSAVTKSTFAQSEGERKRYSEEAKRLKERIDEMNP